MKTSSRDDSPEPASSLRESVRRKPTMPEQQGGLVIGLKTETTKRPFGFASAVANDVPQEPQLDRLGREGHGAVIAGTGQGKLVNCMVPNALMHEGTLIAVDPKGEIAAVTERHRRKYGRVVRVDPFDVLGTDSDALNPFDAAFLPGACIDDCAEMIAWELSAGHESTKDPFWQNTATSLVAGLIASSMRDADPSGRHIGTVIDALNTDDIVYSLAVALDTGKVNGDFAKRRVSEFLQIPDGSNAVTRGCVLASAKQYLHCFEAERARRCVTSSSVPLSELLDDREPITLYLILPPSRARSHRGLYRVLLWTVCHVLMQRKTMPQSSTLLMIDEAASFGAIDQLPMMYGYLRGSGVSVYTAWQSLGQLMDLYPIQHRTIIENCALLQTFGLHCTCIDAVAGLLGVSPMTLRALTPDEQVVAVTSRGPEVLRRVDYRSHPVLRDLADPNPRYGVRADVGITHAR